MSPREAFGVGVRIIGLLICMGSVYGILLAFLRIARLDPATFIVHALLNTPLLILGIWLLRGAPSLIRFAYPPPAEPSSDADKPSLPPGFPNLEAGLRYLAELRANGKDLPRTGALFIAVGPNQQRWIAPRARFLAELGYEVVSTGPTARCLRDSGLQVTSIQNLEEHPATVQQALESGAVRAVLSTDRESEAARQAVALGLLGTTSRVALEAAINGFAALHAEPEVSE